MLGDTITIETSYRESFTLPSTESMKMRTINMDGWQMDAVFFMF